MAIPVGRVIGEKIKRESPFPGASTRKMVLRGSRRMKGKEKMMGYGKANGGKGKKKRSQKKKERQRESQDQLRS